jgi:phage baseplate assembly protein W
MSTSLLVSSKDFIDVDMSFAKHPTSKNILLKKNVNAVKQSVLHLMRLRSGDIPFHPEIKSPIYDFFFENTTSITKIVIESEVIKYLAVFEPRIEVTEVVVTFPDNNSIDCKIIGKIINLTNLVTINVLVDNNSYTPQEPVITVPSAPFIGSVILIQDITSAPSAPYSVSPVMVPVFPNAPRSALAAQINSSSVSLSFIPPRNRGGIAITGYTVTSTPGNITATGTSSPIIVNGLSQNTSYTFTVHATNSVGNSHESIASNSIVL